MYCDIDFNVQTFSRHNKSAQLMKMVITFAVREARLSESHRVMTCIYLSTILSDCVYIYMCV